MDELRHDVTEAFEKSQAELGDLVGARQRLIRNALDARHSERPNRMQLAAGLAAVLIAALVIATFVYIRAGYRPNTEGPPRPAASPTPLSHPLNVPDSTPVILYDDPGMPGQIDGMTWDGKQAGTAAWAPGLGAANPTANLFGSPTQITDRYRRVLGSGNFGLKSFTGTWSDDGGHFCLMVPLDYLGANGLPATLQLVTPGSAPHNVAKVGRVYEQANLSVAACSVRNDRAVVVQSYGNSVAVAQYWVVQLSSGKVLWTHRFDISSPVTVVVSPEAQYVAENQNAGGAGAKIFGADGAHLADLPNAVAGFCWDGSIVVTDNPVGPGQVSEVLWHSGSVIWSAPAGYAAVRVEAQPDGSSLAIWITTLAHQGAGPTQSDLYVVASDGTVLARVRYPPT